VLPEIDYTYHPFQYDVEDTNFGFDSEALEILVEVANCE